jgi:hypothetical protein
LITYRFYIFDKNGDTARRLTRVLSDDNAALTEAKKFIRDGAVEIWRDAGKGHKVARLDRPSPPSVLPAL